MLNEVDLSRADLNLLVLFEAVLREGHVGRAAERLRLTPSAVSHGLGRLRRLLNDPLFLRTPKGVVPTARAAELAGPVAEILARVRDVVATAAPFDPAASTRRFGLGAPDGISAVVLPPLLAELRARAPGVDLSVRQILRGPAGRPWESALAELEARAVDVTVAPLEEAQIPPRFVARTLYEEDFVVAMRAGHPYADDPSLERYCRARHVVVSLTGDERGLLDEVLAERGLARRVALAVPNFMFALALVAESDMLAALPRRFVAMHAARFGAASGEAPVPLPRFRIRAVATGAALADAGVAWLFDALARSFRGT
jgi:DNA-binding transcriptional LysR family regulator